VTAVILRADARALPLPDASVDLIVTSPPYYGLRDYRDGDGSLAGQIGSEATPAEYIAALTACTRDWVRVLKPSGSMFINLGDSFNSGPSGKRVSSGLGGTPQAARGSSAGLGRKTAGQPKSLLGLPWRYALACTDELGLILRRDVIWSKPNGLPESVTDRCRSSHEYVFHLVKRPRYYAAVDEIREPHAPPTSGRNPHGARGPHYRVGSDGLMTNGHGSHPTGVDGHLGFNPLGKLPGSVWEIPSQPLTVPPGLGIDHFAAFPMELPRRIIAGWSPPGICTACGEGRRPVTPATLALAADGKTCLNCRKNHGYGRAGSEHAAANVGPRFACVHRVITGYACACPQPDAPTRPAVVADPFSGTGTTALVASALGRIGIGVDRSAAYCRLARWRTSDPGELAKAMCVPKPPPQVDGQELLWA